MAASREGRSREAAILGVYRLQGERELLGSVPQSARKRKCAAITPLFQEVRDREGSYGIADTRPEPGAVGVTDEIRFAVERIKHFEQKRYVLAAGGVVLPDVGLGW